MRKLRITIGNKSYDVTVEDLTESESYGVSPAPAPVTPARSAQIQPVQTVAPSQPSPPTNAGAVISPMAGVILSILVQEGDIVDKGQPLCVLEAMKMENQIQAPAAGTVKTIEVEVGISVPEGMVLLVLE